MHDKRQPYELDILWAINKCQDKGIKASEAKLDEFAERVPIVMCDYGTRIESDAREFAFSGVFMGKYDYSLLK